MSDFSFSFSGDDIEDTYTGPEPVLPKHAAETGSLQRASPSAFPIAGQPLLRPQTHDLAAMLKALPSKIVYSTLVITLDDGTQISIPRRELWDVRVQLMAEEDDEGLGNLGKDDVKTGVYEGGFKSWESSVDVVKVLHGRRAMGGFTGKILEVRFWCRNSQVELTRLVGLWNCSTFFSCPSMLAARLKIVGCFESRTCRLQSYCAPARHVTEHPLVLGSSHARRSLGSRGRARS